MKRILATSSAVLAGVLCAQPGLAQEAPATGEVTIVGSVADRCLFTLPSKLIDLGELSQAGTGGTAGRLDTSKVDGATETLQGWCNGTAATMSVEAFALENTSFTSAPPSGFDRVVNFTATATANSADATDDSATAGSGAAVSVGMFTGDVDVVLSASSTPAGGLLVAGDYGGLVRVTLTPNVAGPPPV